MAFIMGFISAFKVATTKCSRSGAAQGGVLPTVRLNGMYTICSDKFYNSHNYGLASAAAVILFLIILVLTVVQRMMGKKK